MQPFYPTKTVCGILLFLNHPTSPYLHYEMHSGCWVGSVNFNMAEGMSTTGSKKAVPDTIVELVDVAIYTFSCQSGKTWSLKEWEVFLASYYKHPTLKPRKCLPQFPLITLVDGHLGKDHQSSCCHLFPRV